MGDAEAEPNHTDYDADVEISQSDDDNDSDISEAAGHEQGQIDVASDEEEEEDDDKTVVGNEDENELINFATYDDDDSEEERNPGLGHTRSIIFEWSREQFDADSFSNPDEDSDEDQVEHRFADHVDNVELPSAHDLVNAYALRRIQEEGLTCRRVNIPETVVEREVGGEEQEEDGNEDGEEKNELPEVNGENPN